jgi:1-deoxy-D-xylulose-5-phosphate synthase
VKAGGFGSSILEFMSENNYLNKVKVLGVPDVFVKHGDTKKLKESIGLDKTSLEKTISNF